MSTTSSEARPVGRARAGRPRTWIGSALLFAVIPGACGEAPPPSDVHVDEPAAPTADRAGEGLSPEEIDRLREIGYVGFGEEDAEPELAPVRVHDRARRAPGLDLLIHRDLGWAHILSGDGEILHTWHDPDARHWSNVELLPNGDILVPGSRRKTHDGFLLRMSWDGDIVWRSSVDAHHDVERMPDGRIATLAYDLRRIPAVHATADVKDHRITILGDDGVVLESASTYDMLAARPDVFEFQPVRASAQESKAFVDLLHANSVEWMRHAHLAERDPFYAPEHVLVSFRHQDTVAVFDWRTKEVVWAWGQGILSGQHDATVLENGNLLIFDNGLAVSHSRIVEVDPLRKEIVWEYEAENPADFFSLRKGSSQRLSNGNTLVANSDSGEAFEVTAEGEMVWRYVTPKANKKGKRATIVRIKRYPEAWFDTLLGP